MLFIRLIARHLSMRWLKREKKVLGQTLGFESLSSTRGIQDTLDELGRIQYGVYI